MGDYKLCYVERVDDWGTFKFYFTNNFEDQWGDDWNDRPADCNAEPPYEDDNHDILSIYVEFSWMVSEIIFGGNTYSVEDMNKTEVPWLIFKDKDYTDYKLNGGDTLKEVLNKLETCGDTNYWFDVKLISTVYKIPFNKNLKED